MSTRMARRRAWVVAALLSIGAGWRTDGGDTRRLADPPTRLDASTRVWSTPLPSWSNASPVLVGDALLVTAEPTWLIALDAQTGAERWRARHQEEDALSTPERVERDRQAATLASLRATLAQARLDLGAARAQAQRGADANDVQERIRSAGATITTLDLRIDALERELAPEVPAVIGEATPTPVTDGRTIVALFGNGVVGAWSLDGRRRWMRALEHAPGSMRGYDSGITASPQIVDGLVIVPAGRLVALDLETGETVWTGAPWRDFGSPAVTRVGDVAVVLTPDGRVLRARDGAELNSGLADLWYTGAVAVGDRAYWVGSMGDGRRPGSAWATAWTLHATQGGVAATHLWSTQLDVTGSVYASPATDGESLVTVDQAGHLVTLNARSGVVTSTRDLQAALGGTVYASPVLTAGFVLLSSEAGTLLFADAVNAEAAPVKTALGDTFRSTALAVGADLYVRRRLVVERYTRR